MSAQVVAYRWRDSAGGGEAQLGVPAGTFAQFPLGVATALPFGDRLVVLRTEASSQCGPAGDRPDRRGDDHDEYGGHDNDDDLRG